MRSIANPIAVPLFLRVSRLQSVACSFVRSELRLTVAVACNGALAVDLSAVIAPVRMVKHVFSHEEDVDNRESAASLPAKSSSASALLGKVFAVVVHGRCRGPEGGGGVYVEGRHQQ